MSEKRSTDHCLRAGVAGSREFARVSGFTLDLNPDRFIDDQHLHCVFYGGDIGAFIMPSGWKIVIMVSGDVDLTVETEDGIETDYTNKNNTGAVGSDFLEVIRDDQHLQELDDANAIEWRNNNWVEINYIDPKGRFVDLGTLLGDNIIENDNVLEVFYHDSAVELIAELEKFIKNYDVDTGIYTASTKSNSDEE